MVRVAGLKRRADMGLQVQSADGLSPRIVLAQLAERTRELLDRHSRCFGDDVMPKLQAEGIHIRRWDDLDEEEQTRLAEYFEDKVFPVLTPLAVDPSHPFPYISGLSLNLAVLVRDVDENVQRFARVKVPNNVPRFVVVSQSDQEAEYLPLEDLIAAHLPMLFPGMDVVEHHVFRVTRNADFEVEEDRDEDLLQALERELMRRRFGPAVRLEVNDDIDEKTLALLASEIDIADDDIMRVPGLLDLSSVHQIYDIDRPALKERPFVPITNPRFAEGETPKSVFGMMRDGDVLVHHPYESFATSTQRFIEAGRGRPAGAGHQADALPHVRRLPDRRCAHRCGPGRQTGGGARRDQGPLRRAGQHQVGPRPGARGLPRRVRLRRPQDPLQDRAGGAAGGPPDQALRPRRDRQLQPQDRAHVRGPRTVHRRRGHLRRPHRPVQRAHRLLPADGLPVAAGRPAGHPAGSHRPHRARDRASPARAATPTSASRPTTSSTS